MVPFLEALLVDIFHTLMKMIVKTEVPDEICGDNVSSFKLFKIDLAKSVNLVHHESVKLPTAIKAFLKSLALPVDRKGQFVKECKANLVALIKKLQKNCPLNYLICRHSSSLSPLLIVNSKMRCMPNLVAWLESCTNRNGVFLKIPIALKSSMMH